MMLHDTIELLVCVHQVIPFGGWYEAKRQVKEMACVKELDVINNIALCFSLFVRTRCDLANGNGVQGCKSSK